MKITIIGGGNIGTLIAAEFSNKGHEITIYTSKLKQWSKELFVYDADENLLLTGSVSNVTNSMQEALELAEYVWITMPAQLFSKLAESMLPFVHSGQKIGVIPGSGGAEFAFYKLIEKGCILFGFQRVHSIARLKEYGKAVYELGRKSELQIGTMPVSKTAEICNTIEELFNMPCVALDNYLSVTLTPSNPILHTTRLYTLFKDYELGMIYPRNFLFYEEWTDESSQILIQCDKELQNLCKVIPLKLDSVKSLQEYYESQTVEAMTKKISGIKAFQGLVSPMKEVKNGWIPNWSSRYFTTDFSYGLKIIKDIAMMFHVSTPNIDIVWKWYEKMALKNNIEVFHINLTIEEFIKRYDY